MAILEVPLTLGRGIEEANLDLDEERSEGKAVAMPQLIKVLAAILECEVKKAKVMVL